MSTYILQRGIISVITVLIVVTIVFFILRMIPGDPAQLILGLEAPEERVQEIRTLLGVDRPMYLQYFIWLKDLCFGNFGTSLRSHESVLALLFQRLHVTFWLAALSLIISTTIALPLGIFSALRPWSWIDFRTVLDGEPPDARARILLPRSTIIASLSQVAKCPKWDSPCSEVGKLASQRPGPWA